ncbi:maleylpyruvate isomerase family mycothiol-dependent enzyme [Flexivirga sp. ID2601S]|uniref:Maleylpyruvate isomerase family mycothiol-dependent enzyme n=1 Tax=Flexivirga aerilata TaxID=1656889 RepID=A0A849APX1_9MICO|nr:maleylpyruvate isomerase family mycothiol-dependent enzyme [Flexivirga aerilata]NNG40350.1 maleylpyruvate isomerase family mycothiol-dependent enzyme [Flexivirga aerilata]
MPASLALDDYLDGLATAAARLREDTAELPEESMVPTCPQWSALQLIAHTGMVHRWATAVIRGDEAAKAPSYSAGLEEEGMQQTDPGGWLLAGSDALERALRDAPADLDVFFFLNDAPESRLAWARRQCHETTVHAFDALAARLGQVPSAADAELDPRIAADGIDELLRGFATRRKESMLTSRPISVAVQPDDVEQSWTLRLSPDGTTCDLGLPDRADSTWTGTAAELYLGLWNRGRQIGQDGLDVIGFWRDNMRVEWS